MNTDDDKWDEPVVLGKFEPEPGPESLKDIPRMRADAKALLAQQDARKDKTGVDYVTDRIDRHIEKNPAPKFGLRPPPEEEDPVWFYVLAIVLALLGAIGAIGYAIRGMF
jgi:hypothetical protein